MQQQRVLQRGGQRGGSGPLVRLVAKQHGGQQSALHGRMHTDTHTHNNTARYGTAPHDVHMLVHVSESQHDSEEGESPRHWLQRRHSE